MGQADMASSRAWSVRAVPDATAQAAVPDEHWAVRQVLAGTRNYRLSSGVTAVSLAQSEQANSMHADICNLSLDKSES